jgi:hypothetical protein
MITGMAFGWIGSTTALGAVVKGPVDEMRAGDRLRLGAAVIFRLDPDIREDEQVPAFVESNGLRRVERRLPPPSGRTISHRPADGDPMPWRPGMIPTQSK